MRPTCMQRPVLAMKPQFPVALVAMLCSVLFAAAAFPQSGSTYVDPHQRFTIQVPAGWAPKAFDAGGVSGVNIAHGTDAYVQILVQKGIDPTNFLKALNTGVRLDHPGYRVIDQGLRTVAGQTRMYIVGESPESPNARRARMYLETFAANGMTYAIMASASGKNPAGKDSIGDYELSQQMIQSLTLSGTPGPSSNASVSAALPATPPATVTPPAPAPAAENAAPANTAPSGVADAQPSSPPLSAEDQKKLAALDAALKNGVLTQDEYRTKRDALYASSRPHEDNAAVLKALDQAYQSGVLTQEEYDRKKKDLGIDVPSPAPPAVTSAATPAAPPATPTAPSTETARASAAPPPAATPGSAAAPSNSAATSNIPAPETASTSTTPSSNAAPVSSAPAPNLTRDSAPPALKPMEVVVANSEPQPEPLPKSWITHNDPAGFVVSLPATWRVRKASVTGQIVIHGPRDEEVVIWPLHLQNPELDDSGAGSLLQEFALKFDVLMPWGPVQTARNVSRIIGLGPERSATAVLSWANNPNGASVYFFGLEAPGDLYSASMDNFVGILQSFHIVPDASAKGAPASANPSGSMDSNFENWSDPHEHAFSVSIPQGWQAVGGAYRLSPEDLRYGVVMESPDGQLRATIGDAMIGAFTQPTQSLAAAGLREGGYQTLRDGTRLEVLRYLSGQQFARSYVETLVSRQCSNPQFSSNAAREDLATIFSQSAATEGFTDALLTAGDVSFTCNLDGQLVKGAYVAATIRMAPNLSPTWFVYRLYGYIAFPGREQQGARVIAEILQTLTFSAEWQALQKAAAGAAAQQETEDSKLLRERAMQAISDDQQHASEMLAKSSAQRQREAAEIDRKRENSILGRLDIVDQDTGARYKLADFKDYHYLSRDGYIFSPDAPRSMLRQMIALP